MKDIDALDLLISAEHLERLNVLFEGTTPPTGWDPNSPMSSNLRRNIVSSYETIAEAAEAMGAPVTEIAARRAIRQLKARKKPLSYAALKPINDEIYSRLHDEIGQTNFYCLSGGGASFYSPPEPLFGKEVEARIPEAVDDIGEAGKCFGVGRFTASVFHLMRALEAALRRAGRLLGLTSIEIAWGPLLSAIHTKIEAMSKGRERDAWSEIQIHLYHVKQAWRNDTMHPKATYTEEEAREVFDATKAFMRHLASMLPVMVEELIG